MASGDRSGFGTGLSVGWGGPDRDQLPRRAASRPTAGAARTITTTTEGGLNRGATAGAGAVEAHPSTGAPRRGRERKGAREGAWMPAKKVAPGC